MTDRSIQLKVDSRADVPMELRKFTLVKTWGEGMQKPETLLESASADEVLAFLADPHNAVVDHSRFNPEEILKTAGIYTPHSEAWRGGQGEVRICNNPAIGLRRTK